MAKFKDIAEGTQARRPVRLPLGVNDDGSERTVVVDVRALTPYEQLAITTSASESAAKAGASGEELGSRFDLCKQVHTALVGCVDHDSPKSAPEPYFGSFDEIVRSRLITRDHVAFLATHVEVWTGECGRVTKEMTPQAFSEALARSAGGDPGPFSQMPPFMQWLFMRTTASRLVALLEDKSSSTSSSPG